MTEVSLFGDIPNDIQLDVDNQSVISEDENREDEIRKALEEFNDETFDFGSDDSSENESRCSSVNQTEENNRPFSNKELSLHATMNNKVNGSSSSNGDIGMHGSYTDNNNSIIPNGVNLNMLPNSVMDGSESFLHPGNMNGIVGSHGLPPTINGRTALNGNLVNGSGILSHSHSNNSTKSKKTVTIVENIQKNRGNEEIEESNPTISLLHQQHCPRNENAGFTNSDMWLEGENIDEQLKTLLEVRERQIQRGEEEMAKLQKDKRSLNHQIGLMKTEMVQMKSHQDEAEKFAQLKEKECEYLKTKLREAIDEYEKARGGEIAARDEISQQNCEIEKLRQEIQLLSSIGSSTQQAEISDVVRQLREKHAADYVSWRKVVSDLEGELRTFRRKEQLFLEESFSGGPTVSVCCQTDPIRTESPQRSPSDQFRTKEKTQIAILQDSDDGDVLIKEKKIISLNEKFETLKNEFEKEKEHLVDSYEKEIEEYRRRLATLPTELYHMWEKTQRELGLQANSLGAPICVDAYTSPVEQNEIIRDDSGDYVFKNPDPSHLNVPTQDAATQVEFSSNVENENTANHNVSVGISPTPKDTSSILVQTDYAETSDVVIQTDETLETYKILGQLLASWSNEIRAAKENEEESAIKCKEFEEELNKLRKQFKLLQKIATKCRKEAKRREEVFQSEIIELKERHTDVLQKLNEKLNVLT